MGEGDSAGEVAVGFFVKTGGGRFDGVGEDGVVVGDGEGESSFYGGELS